MSNLTEVLNQNGSFYLPQATNYNKGIASFYDEHFVVVDGQVTIKKSYIDGILDGYYKEQIKKLKLEGSYASDKLVHKLYDINNELISSTEVTLPFSNYINDLQMYKSGNSVTINALNGSKLLKSQKIDLSTYADKINVVKTNNTVSVRLLNGDGVLSTGELQLSEYGTALSVSKSNDALTFQLKNGNTVLSTQTITIREASETPDVPDVPVASVGNIELSMDPRTYVITAKLKNDNQEVVSQSSIDLPLESSIVSMDESNGIITITLRNGNTTTLYIGDLVDGLVSQQEYDEDMLVITRALEGVDTKISTAINNAIYNVLNEDV